MTVDTAPTISVGTEVSSVAGTIRPTRRRDWTLMRLGILLSVASAIFALITLPLVEDQITRTRRADEAQAQIIMQRATESLADRTRALFRSLDNIIRLTNLDLQVAACCDMAAREAVTASLQDAMRQNRLGLHALKVRNPQGDIVLSLGQDPDGSPNEPLNANPIGLPWRTPEGRHVLHVTRQLPGHVLRVTVDLDVLAAGTDIAAPAGSVTCLYRLEDGAMLSSLTVAEIPPPETPVMPVEYLDRATVTRFLGSERGWLTGLDAQGVPTALSFVTLHELGLVVTAKAPQAQLTTISTLRAQTMRLVPLFVLVFGLMLTAVALVVATRRRAREALEQEHRIAEAEGTARAELEHLVRCSPAMLYRGRLLESGDFVRDFLTPNTAEVTGWPPEVLADPDLVWELLTEEERRQRDANYVRAAHDGRAAVEYRLQRPDGSFNWLRNEAVLVRKLDDGSFELAGAMTNITREREIAAYAAMQNRLASLGEISASLAHELTQPMTVIGIAAAIAMRQAEERQDSADLQRHLKTIGDQTERATDIIRHLRAYGRADGGPMTDVSLKAAVHGALGLVGMALRESNVDVTIVINDDLPTVRARQVQVEQILVNLLINARDAMSANPGNARRVALRGSQHSNCVRLEIEDTGPGVPTAMVERLFEPFFTTKAVGEGTGLGLSLCQTMMQQFGGSISVANGRLGAVFTLEFPLARP